jgi:arylsulfatase A-like enzyme
LAGFQPAGDPRWDGRDVWPALTGRVPAAPRQLYWVSARATAAAVRDGDWKLVVTREGDRAELFNVAADPGEKRDLAAAEPQRVAALRKLWAELAARDGDAKVTETGPKVAD